MNLKCPCGNKLNIEVFGDKYDKISHIIQITNWFYSTDIHTNKDIWLCPECSQKAKEIARELFDVVKNPYYNWCNLIPMDERDKY